MKRTIIEIEGPGRDYDFAPFCLDRHYNEAVMFACEWVEEIADALTVGEDAAIKVSIKDIDDNDLTCCRCSPQKYEEHP